MRLLNIGQRKFVLSVGEVKPMDVVEVDDEEGLAIAEGYPEEFKLLDEPKKEVKAEEQPKKKKK